MKNTSNNQEPSIIVTGERLSISQRLHEELGQLIASAKANERLPSEPDLAKNLGVSRATLREAMRTFETQGLIRRRQGSGTFVIHPSYIIDSGLEVLESIDTLAGRIGLPVAMGELQVEERIACEEEAQILGLDAGAFVLDLSRVILAEGRAAAYLKDVLPTDILTIQEVKETFTGSVLDLLLKKGTPPLVSSRTDINATSATSNLARKLGIQRGAVLLRFEAYLYDRSGRVVDYSFSYFLPGYFRFHVIRRVNESSF